jgi:hypothetical protein
MPAQHVKSHGGLFWDTGNERRMSCLGPSPEQGAENGFIPLHGVAFSLLQIANLSEIASRSDESFRIVRGEEARSIKNGAHVAGKKLH